MSAIGLLAELDALGIVVTANGDKLHIEAPPGVVTPELRAALAAHRAAILARLGADKRQETAASEPETLRIPLGWGRWTAEHGGYDGHNWLADHGLRVVVGTPHFGGAFRPMLFLAETTDPEVAV